MKKSLFIFSIFILNIFIGCKKETTIYNLGIDVQSSFNNDKVQIFIDNVEVLNKQLTTNNLLGVCNPDGQITLTKNNESHVLKVIINNILSKSETFYLDKNHYIGINFDSSISKISFEHSDYGFIYE